LALAAARLEGTCETRPGTIPCARALEPKPERIPCARALEPVIGLLLDAVTNSPMIGARNPFGALGY